MLQIVPDLNAAIESALDRVLAVVRDAIGERGRFTVALSGGNTPADLYRRLAAAEGLPWPQVELFFGDERNVPPDDPENNFGMVKRSLLDRAPIPAANVHRIRAELGAAAAAAAYEREVLSAFGIERGAWPRLDLVLLGMGPDGHTASLFPHTEALAVRDRIAVANHVPQLSTDRVTLTLPVLNAARQVLFLVAGADKAKALVAVLEGPADPSGYPSQTVHPSNGQLTWLVDRAAAGRLRAQGAGTEDAPR